MKNVVLPLLPNELNIQMILFSSLRIYRSKLKYHLQFMQKQVEVPFTVYADFEIILEQVVMRTSAKDISLILMPTKLLVVSLELNLNRGYMLE